MNIAGVVVEYNPFHNGHLYHLQKTKFKTKADIVIAVMSGPFLQRGEPALLSKWERTKLALQAGVDIIIELPYSYATQRAEIFAWGAVALLDAMGVTHLCFGSEAGTIDPFLNTIDVLKKNEEAYNVLLKNFLSSGNSYPKAAALAFKKLGLEMENLVDLSQPNNILGFHYIEAVQKLNSSMIVETIQRLKAGYHDEEIKDQKIASATAIRKALFTSPKESASSFTGLTPAYTATLLRLSKEKGALRHWEDFYPFLRYRLITDSKDQLGAIYEAEEGLENRLVKVAQTSQHFNEFMSAVKTKRYTWTRLQRLCTHILTRTTKEEMASAQNKERPHYIRLLGMNERGQKYLNTQKKHLKLPLISNISGMNIPSLHTDIRASECYQLIDQEHLHDFQRTPIRYIQESGHFI